LDDKRGIGSAALGDDNGLRVKGSRRRDRRIRRVNGVKGTGRNVRVKREDEHIVKDFELSSSFVKVGSIGMEKREIARAVGVNEVNV
jgi:hypothetical protein